MQNKNIYCKNVYFMCNHGLSPTYSYVQFLYSFATFVNIFISHMISIILTLLGTNSVFSSDLQFQYEQKNRT